MAQEMVNIWGTDEKNILKTVPKTTVYDEDAVGNFSVVHGFIFNGNNELLLQKLSNQKRQPGRWGSSFAGFVLSHEYPAITAERKAKEELGLAKLGMVNYGYSDMDLGNDRRKRIHLFVGRYNSIFENPNKLPYDTAQIDELWFMPFSGIYPFTAEHTRIFTDTFPLALELFTKKLHEKSQLRKPLLF